MQPGWLVVLLGPSFLQKSGNVYPPGADILTIPSKITIMKEIATLGERLLASIGS